MDQTATGEVSPPALSRWPAPECLLNLTPPDLVLQGTDLPRPGDDRDEVGLRTGFASQGTFAQVDDDRQRPFGAVGSRHEPDLTDTPHDFIRTKPVPLEEAAPEHTVTCLEGHPTRTIESPIISNAIHSTDSPIPSPAARHGRSSRAGPLLFLIRTVHEKLGMIRLDLASTLQVTMHLPDRPASSVLSAGPCEVRVAEFVATEKP